MKNRDILLDVIGEADEKLIPEPCSKKKKSRIIRWTAIGGSICAAVLVACFAFSRMNKNQEEFSGPYGSFAEADERETIKGSEVIKSEVTNGGTGYAGYMAYDASEFAAPNPWKPETEMDALPVYKNLAYTSFYLSEEQMREIAENTAHTLGVGIVSSELSYDNYIIPDKKPVEQKRGLYCINVECSDETSIKVNGRGEIHISFNEKQLPSGYSFTYNNTTADEADAVLEYLSEEYADLLCFDNPLYYSYTHRSYSGDESREYYVYNKTEDYVQDILNFNFCYARFYPDENGGIGGIWLSNAFCTSEYIGDYPIITVDEATEMILNGNYYSSVPVDYIRNGVVSAEDISRTELVYRAPSKDEYYQPYYCFYVVLDSEAKYEKSPEGLNDYGMFYVPAVESEYLSDFKPGHGYGG